MLEKINDIKEALKNECPYSALSLALTIPDICAKVAFPEMNSPKERAERYRLWFDEYVAEKFFVFKGYSPLGTKTYFNGFACYLLRCSILHAGSYNLLEQNHNINIQELRLYFNRDLEMFHGLMYSINSEDKIELDIDVNTICLAICKAAEAFYGEIEDKNLFEDDVFQSISLGDEIRIKFMSLNDTKF